MILVITAGKVGAEATRLLSQRQQPVRILVRDPVKSASLARAGAEVVPGDLEVPETLDAAMRVAGDNARALSLFAHGDADYVTDDVPAILGRPARTFEQFVTDHVTAFS